MEIHWCLKGMQKRSNFGDTQVREVLGRRGIQSEWNRVNGSMPLDQAIVASQAALSEGALDRHVNAYRTLVVPTPYISLSAGCVEFAGLASAGVRYPALATALRFATDGWTVDGYIFRCWVITAPQVSASIPGLADEVRDLNAYPYFNRYHSQGEITAKLHVPHRQIQSVQKVDNTGRPIPFHRGTPTLRNRNFVDPASLSNLVGEIT